MKNYLKSKKRITYVGAALLLVLGAGLIIGLRINGTQYCTSVERYDVLRDSCYFDCDSDQQCEALSKKVDQELSESFQNSKTKPTASKPKATQQNKSRSLYTLEQTDSETNGDLYTVQPDVSLLPQPNPSHKKIWDLVILLIGKNRIKQHIISFEIFNDGNNDTGASVWRSDNPMQWHMNLNEAFAGDDQKDLIRTIIHEYGHVVTLSGGQVDTVNGACPNIQLDEGCGGDRSYINAYYKAFWSRYGYSNDQVGSISENDAANLYADNEDSFVSDYASTNITEDIAESFADFVTKSEPSGNEIKDQKVKFFYDYPELVTMREQIRIAAAKVVL